MHYDLYFIEIALIYKIQIKTHKTHLKKLKIANILEKEIFFMQGVLKLRVKTWKEGREYGYES